MIRRRPSLIAALVLALGITGVPAAPAQAATLPLEYSSDGTSWSSTPPASVFPGTARIVPGDGISSTIYLRSTRAEPTELSVVLTGLTATDPDLATNLTLASAPSSGAGLGATRFDLIKACTPVLVATVVSAYQTIALAVTIAMSSSVSGQQATNAGVYFNLVAGMSDLGGGGHVTGCGDGPLIPSLPATGAGAGAGATMPYTGLSATYPSAAIAIAALGVGWIFVMVGRRRKRRLEGTSP